MSNVGSHKLIALPAVPDVPMTSAAVAPPPAHVQEPGVPGSSTVRPVRGLTDESNSKFSLPFPHDQSQILDGHQPPCSQLHQRRLGESGRQIYVREVPPPLVDAEGQVCWIVDGIIGYRAPHRGATLTAWETIAVPSARKYRIRWLEFPPEQDT